jgi:hypothetical protein
MLDALAYTQHQLEFGCEEDGHEAYWACPAVGAYLVVADHRACFVDTHGATLLGTGAEGEATSPALRPRPGFSYPHVPAVHFVLLP